MDTATTLAEGTAPDGDRWRFELRGRGYRFMCTHNLGTPERPLDGEYGGGAGPYRQPPRKTLVSLLSSGRHWVQLDLRGDYAWRAHAVGHVARGVHAVSISFEDGSMVAAGIHPLATGTHDLFVAFLPADPIFTGVQALDAEGRVIAEDKRPAWHIEDERADRANLTP